MRTGATRGHPAWLIERLSAVLLLGLLIWLILFFPPLRGLTTSQLSGWLGHPLNLAGLCAVLITAGLHAGLGLDTILTDYVATPNTQKLSRLITSGVILFGALAALVASLWLSFKAS